MFRSISITSSPYILNKNLRNYCINSTNESIKKLTERYNNKKYIPNVKINYNNDDNYKPNVNLNSFLLFIALSSISFFIYKRLK
jgi:hypothetical protein